MVGLRKACAFSLAEAFRVAKLMPARPFVEGTKEEIAYFALKLSEHGLSPSVRELDTPGRALFDVPELEARTGET
jgi:hypothetical protein